MSKRTVEHSTVVVERTFKASPSRVFAAWADPEEHAQWNVPGDGWEIAKSENDFRVGGRQMSFFGPKGAPRYLSDGIYLDIVPDVRIISAGAMHDGETRMTTTMCTIELIAKGAGTHLILTDQSAYFGDEKSSDRNTGWEQLLARLEAQLDREGD